MAIVDNALNNGSPTTISFSADVAGPTVTAPSVSGGYATSASIAVTKNGGSDPGSGLAAGTSNLQRDVAPLSGGGCGAFSGSWTNVTLVAGADTGVSNANCYQYREQLTDNVGNLGSSSASAVVKVDTQAPVNAIALSSVSPAGSAFKSGASVYYRGAAAGSLQLSNAVSDSESGPASSAFPALGGTPGGWTHTTQSVSSPAGGPYVTSNGFAWPAGESASPSEAVSGKDAAGNATTSTLGFTNDSSGPTGGALSVDGAAASAGGSTSYSTSGSFPIDLRIDYAETVSASESGLASSTLTRASASYSSPDNCGAFGAPAAIAGAPAQTLATGCYRYVLTGVDNVGNTVSIATTVKVDTSPPSAPARPSRTRPAAPTTPAADRPPSSVRAPRPVSSTCPPAPPTRTRGSRATAFPRPPRWDPAGRPPAQARRAPTASRAARPSPERRPSPRRTGRAAARAARSPSPPIRPRPTPRSSATARRARAASTTRARRSRSR